MYLSILKKDLKRKKTMNIIILLFIAISVVFVSSSAKNLSAVTTSLDKYFEKAGVSDYFVLEHYKGNGIHSDEMASKLDYVSDVKKEEIIYTSNILVDKNDIKYTNQAIISSIDSRIENYFDENDNEITFVKDNEVYFRKSLMNELNVTTGDKIIIEIGDKKKTFEVAGGLKDAAFGGSLMGTPRLLISDKAFNEFYNDKTTDELKGRIVFINTTDSKSLRSVISKCEHLVFPGDQAIMKLCYLMELLIAALLLVVSICLIIIALVILRFTISFTLSEEFREIGIMKAIGIHNIKIRGLYMVKYFAISVIGALIGYLLSIPFANLMLNQTRNNLVISSTGGAVYSISATILLVGIIMLFCFSCTRKVKKFTPVDAIHNGTTGERYKKKGIIKLYKSHFKPVPFMAVNDILSGVKHFGIMLVTFIIGTLLITIVTNTASTLNSPSVVSLFGNLECDAYLYNPDTEFTNLFSDNGKTEMLKNMDLIQNKLADNGIKAKLFQEVSFMFNVENSEGYSYSVRSCQGINSDIEDYTYTEGTAPINKNEIAITKITAKNFGVGIGDKLTIEIPDGKQDFIITGYFQTMNNMGDGIRFSNNFDLSFKYMTGFFYTQLKYTDNPTSAEKEQRFEKIQEIFPDYEIKTPEEETDENLGGMSSNVDNIKYFVLIIVTLISILVAILMEKSFLTKERGEIAMLKAIGFRDSSIIFWQTFRIGIIMVLAITIAIALTNPASQITTGLIFKMMGAESIKFVNDILYAYILFPILVLVTTLISVALTSLSIKSIKTSDINSIE